MRFTITPTGTLLLLPLPKGIIQNVQRWSHPCCISIYALDLPSNFEKEKDKYSLNDVERLSAFAYFYNLGLSAKNFSLLKSLSDRGVGFFETISNVSDIDDKDLEIAIRKFSLIIGSYILEDS